MRKDRISVALTKEIIAKLNEACSKARRSRSDYLQIVLEEHFNSLKKGEEKAQHGICGKYNLITEKVHGKM